jgi:hypothetical protein
MEAQGADMHTNSTRRLPSAYVSVTTVVRFYEFYGHDCMTKSFAKYS